MNPKDLTPALTDTHLVGILLSWSIRVEKDAGLDFRDAAAFRMIISLFQIFMTSNGAARAVRCLLQTAREVEEYNAGGPRA